ncbi:MAG TPA: aldehyde dehydrogenase family protein, partial [Nitrospiria bacterium]|nr:aldehyde dehydrogenase family protein [Nitrospiria bacterium]
MKSKPFYSGGEWVSSPKESVILDPYKREPVARISLASSNQVQQAVEQTVAAFLQTRKLDAYTRSEILRQVSAGIESRKEEFAKTLSME